MKITVKNPQPVVEVTLTGDEAIAIINFIGGNSLDLEVVWDESQKRGQSRNEFVGIVATLYNQLDEAVSNDGKWR